MRKREHTHPTLTISRDLPSKELGPRFCTRCGEKKPASHFLSKSAKCRQCRREIWEANRLAEGLDPNQIRRDKKNERRRAQRKGQLTDSTRQRIEKVGNSARIRAHYDEQLLIQKGKCSICKSEETNFVGFKRAALSRDHCHDSGQLRGLLCRACNAGLGYFGDNPDLIKSALSYLRDWQRRGQLAWATPSPPANYFESQN